MDQDDEHETSTTVTDPNIAEIIKIALADEGVESVIEGEHQAGMTGIFPVRILVPKHQIEQAREIRDRHAAESDNDSEEGDDGDAEE
ncbi:MAG: DUF2007 domain-containing protein [Planctomycetales bacterium]